jgi:hypothetical protein
VDFGGGFLKPGHCAGRPDRPLAGSYPSNLYVAALIRADVDMMPLPEGLKTSARLNKIAARWSALAAAFAAFSAISAML